MLVEVAYVGSKGGLTSKTMPRFCNQDPVPGPGDNPVETTNSRSSEDLVNIVNRGNSSYNALQLKVKKTNDQRALCFLKLIYF